jgi:DNA-binding NtrC family response regulator
MANVLLVEDEADLLQALEALLVLEGHNVRTAENGEPRPPVRGDYQRCSTTKL